MVILFVQYYIFFQFMLDTLPQYDEIISEGVFLYHVDLRILLLYGFHPIVLVINLYKKNCGTIPNVSFSQITEKDHLNVPVHFFITFFHYIYCYRKSRHTQESNKKVIQGIRLTLELLQKKLGQAKVMHTKCYKNSKGSCIFFISGEIGPF